MLKLENDGCRRKEKKKIYIYIYIYIYGERNIVKVEINI